MDWDDLRFFLAVMRAGSTAGAARRLKVQHTTVGRRLSALELALGTRLFARESSGTTPTETASQLLPLAEEVERAVAAVAQRAEGSDGRIAGRVRLTCSEAFSGYLFARLPELQALHPGLSVEILAGNRIYDLQAGEADIAVRMVPTEQPRLVSQRLADAGWSLYAAQSYLDAAGRPDSLAALESHRILGFDQSMSGTPGAKWLAAHLPQVRFALVANSVVTLAQAVEAGAGIGMMPCFLTEHRPSLVRLFPEVVEMRHIWLVFHPEVAHAARIRVVIDFLVRSIRADRALMSGATGVAGDTDDAV